MKRMFLLVGVMVLVGSTAFADSSQNVPSATKKSDFDFRHVFSLSGGVDLDQSFGQRDKVSNFDTPGLFFNPQDSGDRSFYVSDAWMKLKATMTPWLSGVFGVDYAPELTYQKPSLSPLRPGVAGVKNKLLLTSAYLNFTQSPHWSYQVGQMFLPFGSYPGNPKITPFSLFFTRDNELTAKVEYNKVSDGNPFFGDLYVFNNRTKNPAGDDESKADFGLDAGVKGIVGDTKFISILGYMYNADTFSLGESIAQFVSGRRSALSLYSGVWHGPWDANLHVVGVVVNQVDNVHRITLDAQGGYTFKFSGAWVEDSRLYGGYAHSWNLTPQIPLLGLGTLLPESRVSVGDDVAINKHVSVGVELARDNNYESTVKVGAADHYYFGIVRLGLEF